MADSLSVTAATGPPGATAQNGTGLSLRGTAQAGPVRPAKLSMRARLRKVNWVVGMVALPGLAAYTIAIVYPIIDTLYTSLFNWNIISGVHKYVGISNYTEFFHDGTFRQAAENTATWTVIYVPCVLALGLLVALWLNRPFRGRTLLRIVFYLPFVLSNVAAGLMWTFIYYPTIGAADTLTRNLGLGDVEFLASPHLVLFSVLVAFIWQGVGAMMVIFLAGLQSIPKELFEAAEVNGATSWQRLHLVTAPLLRESFVVAGSLALITSLNVFNIIYVMTQGGPGDDSQVLGTLTYFDSFQFGEFGQGSAVAGVLVIVVLLLGVTFIRRVARDRYA